jgi:hypothetical protein
VGTGTLLLLGILLGIILGLLLILFYPQGLRGR